MKKNYFLLVSLFCLLNTHSSAQLLTFDMDGISDHYRRTQLVGKLEPNISLCILPLNLNSLENANIIDQTYSLVDAKNKSVINEFTFANNHGRIKILPISAISQFNSHHPEGINDGSMIPAKGYQVKLNFGMFFKLGPLSVKISPEYVYAMNNDFIGYTPNITNNGINFPDSPYGGIELPERFGESAYSKAFWGQSSIRLNLGSISLGLSNENLWWGPGYRNSLLMTNSAPGFLHLTLNTIKPLRTFIGSFEGQIIAGKLDNSGYQTHKNDEWRYINAMSICYQPKWISGLFLGINRSFLIYHDELRGSLGDYLPVISFLSTSKPADGDVFTNKFRNQLMSVFMRYLFLEAKGEIYFEYGREDHSWDMRDIILEPSHSSAYIIGFRKLFKFGLIKNSHLQLIFEISNLSANQTTINRNYKSANGFWYQHSHITQGYTNKGQLLGAGIGPGSKSQTIEISWFDKLKQIGIRIERYVHNNDFWYDQIKDIRSNWVDMSYTVFSNWDIKNYIISAKLKFVSSRNYQWLYEPDYENSTPTFWMDSPNTFNLHAQLGLTYRF